MLRVGSGRARSTAVTGIPSTARPWISHAKVVAILAVVWLVVRLNAAPATPGFLGGLEVALANLFGLALLGYVILTTAIVVVVRSRPWAAGLAHLIGVGLVLGGLAVGMVISENRRSAAAAETEAAEAEWRAIDAAADR